MEIRYVQQLIADSLEHVESEEARFKLRTAYQLLDAFEVEEDLTRAKLEQVLAENEELRKPLEDAGYLD